MGGIPLITTGISKELFGLMSAWRALSVFGTNFLLARLVTYDAPSFGDQRDVGWKRDTWIK